MNMIRPNKILLSLAALLWLAGCSSNRPFEFENLTEEVEAIKSDGGVYKVGTTYTALGQKYTPREDYHYTEVGIASWYGADFHNKRTAIGRATQRPALHHQHPLLHGV